MISSTEVEAYTVSSDGTNPDRLDLPPGITDPLGFVWSSDGNRLAFSAVDGKDGNPPDISSWTEVGVLSEI